MEAEEKVLTAQYTSDISDGSSSKKRKHKRAIDSINLTPETGKLLLCLNVFILYYYYYQFKCEILIGHSNIMRTKKSKISTGDTVDSKLKTKIYKSKALLTNVQLSESESDDNMSDFCKHFIIFNLNTFVVIFF